VHAGGVAARSIEARYQAELDWVTAHAKHDRDRRSGSLSRDRGVGRTGSSDHPHAAANEIGRQLRQAIVLAFRPPILYRQILALDVPGVSKALPERGHKVGPLGGGTGVNEPNHRHRLVLRARRERPRRRRAAEQRGSSSSPIGGVSKASVRVVVRACRGGRAAVDFSASI